MSEAALELIDIRRTFVQAGVKLEVLQGATLRLNPGEIVALVGPSGAGKSTLLHIAGLLERPDDGRIVVAGHECGQLDDDARTALRRRSLGFVYQFHHLLPEFSALENIILPQMIDGRGMGEAKSRAEDLLASVGLAQRTSHRPARLSGGEQQRVAIVRALANAPRVLLGDEPTGNLDHRTAEDVMGVLAELVRRTKVAALIATHNLDLARQMDRILRIEDGVVTAA